LEAWQRLLEAVALPKRLNAFATLWVREALPPPIPDLPLATLWDSIKGGGKLYGEENQENPEMRAVRRFVRTIPALAEVLLSEMPVEELEPETSPVSDSGQ
jgi:hypothetical protein